MNDVSGCLSKQVVRDLLAGVLAPDQLAEAEAHLTNCPTCCEQIEAEIGDQQWWQDAQTSLAANDGVVESQFEAAAAASAIKSLLGPSDDPAMLGRVGPYEVVGVLGQGGMGIVFKAFDRSLDRYVAIKMLLPHLAVSAAARKRFAREAQAAAAIVNDHVLAIHSVSQWQGVPYFVMPYSSGHSLQRRLNERGPLELCEILRIAMQTAKGLAAAHAQGIVHRDVKPGNILLDEGVERVALMDFGLARAADDVSLTRTGTLAGTPQFMSPEQVRGEPVTPQSDLFNLGSVLYAMCTGVPPFRADSSYAVMRLITDQQPVPIMEINPGIPPWLCTMVDKLMAKRPQDRLSSAQEVAELFEACLAHVQQPARYPLPPGVTKLLPVVPKAHSKGVWIMFATVAAVVGILWFGQAERRPSDPPATAPVLAKSQENIQLHVVGCYSASEQHGTSKQVHVKVRPTDKPIVLAVCSYFQAHWHVELEPGAQVQKIIIGGWFEQTVGSMPPNVPVEVHAYFPLDKTDQATKDAKCADCFFAWEYGDEWYEKMEDRLLDLTGLQPTTFQGSYFAKSFIVDGKEGLISDAQRKASKQARSVRRVEDPFNDVADVADVPSTDTFVTGDSRKRYFLIGHPSGSKNGKRSLLVVLPGGDGSSGCQPFVRRIYKHALDDRWVVAQIIAPQWDDSQFERVVWPTRGTPYPAAEFTTEELISTVIQDVLSKTDVTADRVFLLGWSSGGPACYAAMLQEDSSIVGAFIAMSIFKPEKLPMQNARGKKFYLLQSPDDRLTPIRYAHAAQKALVKAGATVELTEYAGGHGWKGNIWNTIRDGLHWLER